jgi:DNA-directed RNA polymerase subunit RPC12/RpoP
VKDVLCPNCGKLIDIQSAQPAITCKHCQEKLLVVAGSRVVLANPVRTYFAPDAPSEKDGRSPLQPSVATRPPVSAERKKKTARLAYERIAREEQLDRSGFVYGMLAILFGGFLGILSWLRLEYLENDWTGRIGLATGVCVVALGAFVSVRFFRSLKSAQAIKCEIEKELKS